MYMRTILKQLANWRQHHSKDHGNPMGGMCASHWQFCATYASVPSTPRMPFGAHFGKNITIICKLCGKIIHRLKLKSTKFEENCWTYAGLINICMGSGFFLSPCIYLITYTQWTIEDKCCNKVSPKRSLRKLTLFRYVTGRFVRSSIIKKSLLMESS